MSILENGIFAKLNNPPKDIIISVLWHILSIKGKINFLQLERFSSHDEQTFRNHFGKKFDFFSFNKLLIDPIASDERILALDPQLHP